jgi:hypothetical protein
MSIYLRDPAVLLPPANPCISPYLISPPGKLSELSPQQRERVLQYLLEKLNTFTAGRGGLAPDPIVVAALRNGDAVILPPIPSMRRKGHTVTSAQGSGMAGSSGMYLDGLKPQSPDRGMSPEQKMMMAAAAGSGPGGNPMRKSAPAVGMEGTPLPGVEELLSKVMSDVRPWGKKSQELPASSSKGIFLKKGTTTRTTSGGGVIKATQL